MNRIRMVRLCVIAGLACLSASEGIAADLPPKERVAEIGGTPTDEDSWHSVRDLKQAPEGVSPELRHGKEARSLDWPASLYTTFNTATGKGGCTAALVGPHAVLTAAHCVPPSGRIAFDFNKSDYTAACTQHPDYLRQPRDASADFAICIVSKAITTPVAFRYETVEQRSLADLRGMSIFLTGYGCMSDVVADRKIDHKYRIGSNTVVATSDTKEHKYAGSLYSPAERNNLFTSETGANVCPGDSGGPVFVLTEGFETGSDYANRTIVGVNSRVFYVDAKKTTYGASILSASGGPAFTQWAKAWAEHEDRKLQICGLTDSQPDHCRGTGK